MLDFTYACIQLIHNLGAATVVGGPAAALWPVRESQLALKRVAQLVTAGWLAQASAGLGFGLTSYFLRGEIPDITGVALFALATKIFSTICGIPISLFAIKRISSNRSSCIVFKILLALGVLSISAAAFLRWYL